MDSIRLTLSSPTANFSHTTTERTVKIGRSLNCDFSVPRDDLSREHCLFQVENNEFYITDLGSRNGIHVDRVKIPPNERVKINSQTTVVLSNIYILKINAMEIKTKADLLKDIITPEAKTVSFQLELEESHSYRKKGILPSRLDRKTSLTTSGDEESAPSSSISDNTKMVVAFLIILAYVLYHALGE